MNVTVVWATVHLQDLEVVELPAGATVAEAVARSGLVARHGIDEAALGFAIFGRRVRADAALADGDRIELTRALTVDPRAARVRRAGGRTLAKPPGRVKPRPAG